MTVGVAGLQAQSVVIGDLNGDGRPDLAATSAAGGAPGPGTSNGAAPPAASGPGTVAPAAGGTRTPPPACPVRSVALTGITPTASAARARVRLEGLADGSLVGRRVAVRRDGRTIARTTVLKGGVVRVTVAAPGSATARTAARYRLVVGVHRSLALKATRLIASSARRILGDGRVRVTGRVTGADRSTRLIVRGERLCTEAPFGPARAIRTDRRGRFSLTLPAPAAGQVALYRVETAGRRTVTLPVAVRGR